MDREAKEEYLVVIQAKDMGGHSGGLSGTTTLTVTLTDVNDNPPKFAQSKWFPALVKSHGHLYYNFPQLCRTCFSWRLLTYKSCLTEIYIHFHNFKDMGKTPNIKGKIGNGVRNNLKE